MSMWLLFSFYFPYFAQEDIHDLLSNHINYMTYVSFSIHDAVAKKAFFLLHAKLSVAGSVKPTT